MEKKGRGEYVSFRNRNRISNIPKRRYRNTMRIQRNQRKHKRQKHRRDNREDAKYERDDTHKENYRQQQT